MSKPRAAPVFLLALLALGSVKASASSSIVVGDVWSRPATGNAVVYASIRNGGSSADELIGAFAPGAGSAELHETTTAAGGAAMPGMSGMSTTVSMKKVDVAAVPAGGQLTLKPGGYHIMLIGLKRRWNVGDSFQIRFHFKQAGWIATNGFIGTGAQ